MTIRLLGTGAADGIPPLYSANRVTQYAREHGGKDKRTRCGALIDGILKIDLPPDTLGQLHRDNLDPRDWKYLIFTHSHDDHFAPAEIQYGLYPFNDQHFLSFTIYGNAEICRRINELYPSWPIELIETRSFEPFDMGAYRVTPVHANHKLDEDSHNILFQKDGKTILYGTDTGIWFEETWSFLSNYRLDVLVIEATEGLSTTDYDGHLSVPECLGVVGRLRDMGVVHPATRIVTTHHSHNGEATHAELEAALNPHGVEVGFDGIELSA